MKDHTSIRFTTVFCHYCITWFKNNFVKRGYPENQEVQEMIASNKRIYT